MIYKFILGSFCLQIHAFLIEIGFVALGERGSCETDRVGFPLYGYINRTKSSNPTTRVSPNLNKQFHGVSLIVYVSREMMVAFGAGEGRIW